MDKDIYIFFFGGFIVGFLVCLLVISTFYMQETNTETRKYNGLWLPQDNLTKSQAVDTAKSYDSYGNWVCVNIKQMSIEDIYKTCTHETLHEFWVQKCTENVTKCLNGIK